ncbi:peptidoglycan-binding domain-containing protein [Paenibacillus sp. 32O-W]|uniref:peptidoglycan-binding domain-containing protein n=1 Tax=Paenibacillus sp. 32O-W TaxID=1695218 RepID=UPI0009EA6FB0|nr:peptidoglycan-binding domain-containing protein [Paenibacillus sp. 32O-W]
MLQKRFKKSSFTLTVMLVTSLFLVQVAFASSMYRTSWPTLRSGSTGGYVGSLQADLWSSGLSATVGTVDEVFGSGTKNGVIEFQEDNGLSGDGVVGSGTWGALESYTTNLDFNSRLYRNPGSTTYQTYYSLLPDGAGGQSYSYYLEYRSNGYVVASGVVWSE